MADACAREVRLGVLRSDGGPTPQRGDKRDAEDGAAADHPEQYSRGQRFCAAIDNESAPPLVSRPAGAAHRQRTNQVEQALPGGTLDLQLGALRGGFRGLGMESDPQART